MTAMPNRTGKCSGPTLNEYIGPICAVRIHVASECEASECEDEECEDEECEDEECEDEECEGYEHDFLAFSSWELPNIAVNLKDKTNR